VIKNKNHPLGWFLFLMFYDTISKPKNIFITITSSFMNNSKKGFTLIELLVVVAIIGILAAVVLASLNNARKKGQDSAIKTQMTSLRSQAELYATSHANSYNNLFTSNNTWASTDTSVQAILTSIHKQSTVHTVGSGANAWAVQVRLVEDTTKYLCTDYTALFETGGVPLVAGDTVCP
jgi:prepilin-type N-terminal cleavage/methylation domain-containing protein